jgi:hypothetical protein
VLVRISTSGHPWWASGAGTSGGWTGTTGGSAMVGAGLSETVHSKRVISVLCPKGVTFIADRGSRIAHRGAILGVNHRSAGGRGFYDA